MAESFSFDIVSDFDKQELLNALDQAKREIAQRYDLKGYIIKGGQLNYKWMNPKYKEVLQLHNINTRGCQRTNLKFTMLNNL